MARYIDADALYEKLYPLDLVDKRLYTINAKAVADAIAKIPTVDVVEVVRCKDCKNWDSDNIKKHTYSSEDCTLVDFAECTCFSNWSKCYMMRYNDYCSLAEKKGE